MKILVVAASKHGSTREIGEAIGEALRRAGHEAAVYDADAAPAAVGFGAAVIGSAVYAGNWMKAAQQYVADNQEKLAEMPVWLFSSGPLGAENPQPQEPPVQLEELMGQTGARAHQIFVGKLDNRSLNLGEKLIVKAVKAPYGDFRNWEAIRRWAGEIAAALAPVAAA